MAQAMIKALGAGVILQAFAIGAQASETPPPAYQLAAYQAGIPSEVLYSVALQESGTRLRGQTPVPHCWSRSIPPAPNASTSVSPRSTWAGTATASAAASRPVRR